MMVIIWWLFEYCCDVIVYKNILTIMEFEFDAAYPYLIIAIALIFAIYYGIRDPPFNPVPPL